MSHISPFKFLDSYTKDDRDIFFGRDRETDELYGKVFESKILLVYGISGTGKTSLINCGLANKFSDSDWLPFTIRRGGNINESWLRSIEKAAITPVKTQDIRKAVRSVYLDHFKPLYFIFDQFKELFIFGSKSEKSEFISHVKGFAEADIQCRFIFVLREEYLAGITEFEKHIPGILANRIRIEKMDIANARLVIERPCKVHNIAIEPGVSDALIEKLNPGAHEVELTYLQVLLDKIYKLAIHDKNSGHEDRQIIFTKKLVDQTGNVSDLLGSFLDEQIIALSDPDTGLTVLKAFVSIKGTKRQATEDEIYDFAKIIGKNIGGDTFRALIHQFVSLRILHDKDESGRYELRHDALAAKIYEKITLVEKELIEIRQFIDNAYSNYRRRNILLNASDLEYIAPYESKMYLGHGLDDFIKHSKKVLQKAKRRKLQYAAILLGILLIVLTGFTIWALRERSRAIDQTRLTEKQTRIAEQQKNEALLANKNAETAKHEAIGARQIAEQQRADAIRSKAVAEQQKTEAFLANAIAEEEKQKAQNAKEIAEKELYANIVSSVNVSNINSRILYAGIQNKIQITVNGVTGKNLKVTCLKGSVIPDDIDKGVYLFKPDTSDKELEFNITGLTSKGEKISFPHIKMKVVKIPDPSVKLGWINNGIIDKLALSGKDIFEFYIPDFPYKVEWKLISGTFNLSGCNDSILKIIDEKLEKYKKENQNQATRKVKTYLRRLQHELYNINGYYMINEQGLPDPAKREFLEMVKGKVSFGSINVQGTDGLIRQISSVVEIQIDKKGETTLYKYGSPDE
ncbi:MAG: hypothetical protein HY958_11220 [Bacteroidia bacterium]|nr:hypothetical protein [Bacteroidia bacterium]